MEFDKRALDKLVRDSGISFRENSKSFIFSCPKCSKKDKLYVRKEDGRFVCFYCAEIEGFKGKAEYALQALLERPLGDLRHALYGSATPQATAHFEVELRDFWEEPQPMQVEHQVMRYPFDFFSMDHPHAERGREYLSSRGISTEVAQKYDIRYCPTERRVIFPVKVGGNILGWQARAVYQTEVFDERGKRSAPKILTSPGLQREHCLMWQDSLLGSEHCILTEGPVDALKCDGAGGAVATMGKAVATTQLDIIRSYGIKKLYIALDPDAAAEVQRIAKYMADLELYRLLPAPGYKDLGEMPVESVTELFRNAQRLSPGQIFIHLRH